VRKAMKVHVFWAVFTVCTQYSIAWTSIDYIDPLIGTVNGGELPDIVNFVIKLGKGCN
jgi:hypothetical protein